MGTLWIEVFGFSVRAPVTAGTNLLLAIQCLVSCRLLSLSSSERHRMWSGFFLLMALATLAGAFKHGARHLMTEEWLLVVLALSNLGSAVATYFAQRAAIVSYSAPQWRASYHGLVGLQLGLFVLMNIAWGPELMILIVSMAIGLIPVLVVEGIHARHLPGAGLVSAGLTISAASGLVYVVPVSLDPWLNHIDIAHVIMSGSLVLVLVGVRRSGGVSWT